MSFITRRSVTTIKPTPALLSLETLSSPMARRPSSGLLRLEDPQQVFLCGQTLSIPSKAGRPSPGLVKQEVLYQVFYSKKTFTRYAVARRTSPGLVMWPEDLQQIFYGQKIFVNSAVAKKTQGLIKSEDIQQFFYGKNICKRPFYVARRKQIF